MKLIIAGGRDVHLDSQDFAFLDWIHAAAPVTEVVSGTADGVDADGELWAARHGIPVRRFPADWAQHGRAAGCIRNGHMAQFVRDSGHGAVVVFPGGAGTDNMFETARAMNIPIFDRRHLDAPKQDTCR